MEVYTQADFDTYRRNYALMLEILFSNPLISDFFNNVANPSQLDGYSALMLDALRPYSEALLQNLVTQIESEFIFVKYQNEPFIFLRERSRLAARLTGDFIAQKMQPLLRPFLRKQIEAVDEDMTVYEVSELFLHIFFSTQFVYAMPLEVCFLIKQVVVLAKVYGFDDYAYMLSGNLLFLRCFCPAMSAPDYYKISEQPFTAKQRTTLIKASKILNYIPNSIQAGFYLDDGLEDDAEFIFGHQQYYIDFVNEILKRDYKRLEKSIIYHTKYMTKGYSKSEHSSTSVSAAENNTPSEFIESYLKCYKNDKIQISCDKYSLQTLGSIHATIIDYKTKIYDIVQSIYHYTGDYHADFEIDIHRQRFERLLKTYADYYYLEDTKLYGTMALLYQLLAKSPPLVEAVDRKRPAFWQCQTKSATTFLKFSYSKVYFHKGNPQEYDYGAQHESGGACTLSTVICGADIVQIKVLDKVPAIELAYVKNGTTIREYLTFLDTKMQKEAAAQFVETCYTQSPHQDEFLGVKRVVLFKDSFSVFDAVSGACGTNYHLQLLVSAQAVFNSVIINMKEEQKLFLQFSEPATCHYFCEELERNTMKPGS